MFLAVVVLGRVQVPAPDGLDIHVFARLNAVLNSLVSLLLLAGLFGQGRNWTAHRGVMLTAMALNVLFLVSYIAHHLFAGETSFGGQGPSAWCTTWCWSPTSCWPPPACPLHPDRPPTRPSAGPTRAPQSWPGAYGRSGSA